MTYAVSILRRAQKELQHLPREDYERVRDAIRALAHEPRPAGCLVLTGRVTLSSQPTVWLELLNTGATNAKLLAGCPPELPGYSQDTWHVCSTNDDEHFTHTSLGVWNALCSLVKHHAPPSWNTSVYGVRLRTNDSIA